MRFEKGLLQEVKERRFYITDEVALHEQKINDEVNYYMSLNNEVMSRDPTLVELWDIMIEKAKDNVFGCPDCNEYSDRGMWNVETYMKTVGKSKEIKGITNVLDEDWEECYYVCPSCHKELLGKELLRVNA